jgi:hypothetical protein
VRKSNDPIDERSIIHYSSFDPTFSQCRFETLTGTKTIFLAAGIAICIFMTGQFQ